MAEEKHIPSGRPGLKEQLRRAIRASGLSLQELSRQTGVGADRLSRFVRDERGLSLDAAEVICEVIGLDLTRRQETTSDQPS